MGSMNNNDYSIDLQNGVISLDNRANRFVNDELVLRLRRNGQDIEVPITVSTSCGPGSTDIDPPTLPNLVKMPNQSSMDLSVSGSFTTSNSNCPIEQYTLFGDGGNRVTLIDADEYFEFSVLPGGQEFRLGLRSQYQNTPGKYFYTVIAQAFGNAMSTASGYILIET